MRDFWRGHLAIYCRSTLTSGCPAISWKVRCSIFQRVISFVLCVLFYQSIALAQQLDPRFDHLTIRDGLPHTTVRAIAQDERGFLWLGTQQGLSRYDGYGFKTYRADRDDPGSLSDSDVFAVYLDSRGELWVGTRSGGLDRLLTTEDRFLNDRHDPDDPGSLSPGAVFSILEDRTGALWVGTRKGLNRLDRTSGSFERFFVDDEEPGGSGNPWIGALFEDGGGELWIGTEKGLKRFERDAGTFVSYRHDPADPTSLSHDMVMAIAEDAAGRLWVGTQEGLNRLDRSTSAFTRYRHDPADPTSLPTDWVSALLADRSGDLWIGTRPGGLARYLPAIDGFAHYRHDRADPWSLSGDSILALFEDRNDNLWLATWAGVDKYVRAREAFVTFREGSSQGLALHGRQVWGIHEDRSGILWVGTLENGLNRIDRRRREVVHYPHDAGNPASLPHATVTSVLEDRSGTLWVGTWGGLSRFDQERRRFISYRHDPEDPRSLAHSRILSLFEDREGRLWIGTADGLQRYDPLDDAFVRPGSGGAFVGQRSLFSIAQDVTTGAIWFGSFTEGLYRLQPELGELDHFRHDPADPRSVSSDRVAAVHVTAEGTVWIGTVDTGLDRFDAATGAFTHYGEKDGLVGASAYGILEDADGFLWLSSAKGLSRFDPQTASIESFDVDDGLQGDEFLIGSAFRSRRGELFFGGVDGLNAFFPERIVRDPRPPEVVITDFQLFGKSVEDQSREPSSPLERPILETRALTLTHRHRVFGFEFAALHSVNPRKHRYAYRLEGFDKDWSSTDASRRFAQYTNLDAGEYVFRVKASNSTGVWNEEGAALRITVLPPPWKTWWAYSLYGLVLASGLVAFVWHQRREVERQRRINTRLREVDHLKDQFLANTSHELRTPLYGMAGIAESLIDGAKGELPAPVKADLGMIVTSGRRLSGLVNDILDFAKLAHDKFEKIELTLRPVDLHTLVEVVATLSRPLIGDKDLRLLNAVPVDLPPVEAEESRLQQILYNLIGNAIKFTESGLIEVSAVAEEDRLVVRVSDTGIGIAEDDRERIFGHFEQADASAERSYGGTGLGLAVTKELVALHGGSLWVESTPGRGSTFFFTLARSSGELPEAPAASEELGRLQALVPVEEPTVDAAVDGLDVELPRATLKILVVDDEPVIRRVLTNHLSVQHYQLTQASSGQGALRRLEEESFDLVLLDIMMPRMSGYEVCRRLRELYPRQDLPVIFLTAKNQVSDLVTAFSVGANDFLSKPIAKGELLARVKMHLDLLYVHRHLEELVEERTAQVKVLGGLLPICGVCQKIRDDEGYWNALEDFLDEHSEAQLSHGLCPECAVRLYPSAFSSEASDLEVD